MVDRKKRTLGSKRERIRTSEEFFPYRSISRFRKNRPSRSDTDPTRKLVVPPSISGLLFSKLGKKSKADRRRSNEYGPSIAIRRSCERNVEDTRDRKFSARFNEKQGATMKLFLNSVSIVLLLLFFRNKSHEGDGRRGRRSCYWKRIEARRRIFEEAEKGNEGSFPFLSKDPTKILFRVATRSLYSRLSIHLSLARRGLRWRRRRYDVTELLLTYALISFTRPTGDRSRNVARILIFPFDTGGFIKILTFINTRCVLRTYGRLYEYVYEIHTVFV